MSGREADWRTRWIARAGVAIVWLLARTWRVRFVQDEQVGEFRRQRQPLVYVLWHGELLMQLWAHRNRGISVLISEHRDGELIARIAEAFGYGTVRGSSSRGATRALIGLVREVEQGRDVAVTPDGPRGPRHSFAPGALLVAQRSGRPIVPVGAGASRSWQLKSWDRFVIPKPFARVTIAYGPAMSAPGGPPSQLDSATLPFQAALLAASAEAAR